jgi:hypothetical protein
MFRYLASDGIVLRRDKQIAWVMSMRACTLVSYIEVALYRGQICRFKRQFCRGQKFFALYRESRYIEARYNEVLLYTNLMLSNLSLGRRF